MGRNHAAGTHYRVKVRLEPPVSRFERDNLLHALDELDSPIVDSDPPASAREVEVRYTIKANGQLGPQIKFERSFWEQHGFPPLALVFQAVAGIDQ